MYSNSISPSKFTGLLSQRRLFLCASIVWMCCSPQGYASVIVQIREVGSDLQFSTVGGTIDLTGMTLGGAYGIDFSGWGAGMDPSSNTGVWTGGTAGGSNNGEHWTGSISVNESNWNMDTSFNAADSVSVSGAFFGFGVNTSSFISTPAGFIAGVNAVSASTVLFSSRSLADINLSVGESITATFGDNSDTISVSVVPEPSTTAAFMAAVILGFVAVRRRQR